MMLPDSDEIRLPFWRRVFLRGLGLSVCNKYITYIWQYVIN